jgi:hypothetical protein
MSVRLDQAAEDNVLEVYVTGKLTKEDYERFTPVAERAIGEHGKIRVLFDMHDFHGWKASAMWEDLKFGLHHFKDIERVAIVGEKAWEHGAAVFCKPFTAAEIRYFDRSESEAGRLWIRKETRS